MVPICLWASPWRSLATVNHPSHDVAGWVSLPPSGIRRNHSAFHERGAKARAGIPKDSLYQGTRHIFESDALLVGMGMESIRKMLGHSNPRSTKRA